MSHAASRQLLHRAPKCLAWPQPMSVVQPFKLHPAAEWHPNASSMYRCVHEQQAQPAPWHRISTRTQSQAASAMSAATSQALEYETIAQPCRMEVEVKKSRFIVTAWPVTSAKQAMTLIRQHSDPSASHNCFAYRIGSEYRSSDDGEPGGTAGRPILSAIEGEGLQGVAVLVTRFFGGVKLGAGGLVRAYGGAARDCLKAAPRAIVKTCVQLQLIASYEALGSLYNLFDKFHCERLCEEYQEKDGSLLLRVSVEAASADALMTAVSDASSGRIVPQLYVPDTEEGEG